MEKRGRESRLFVEKLLSHSTRKNCRGKSLCFWKNLVWKDFMDKTGRGVWRFYVEFVMPHCTKTFRRGTLVCFRKYTEPENFKDKRGRGAYHDFPSNLLCLTVRKFFVEVPFCVSENFWYRKMFEIGKRGAYLDSPFILFFVSLYRNLT